MGKYDDIFKDLPDKVSLKPEYAVSSNTKKKDKEKANTVNLNDPKYKSYKDKYSGTTYKKKTDAYGKMMGDWLTGANPDPDFTEMEYLKAASAEEAPRAVQEYKKASVKDKPLVKEIAQDVAKKERIAQQHAEIRANIGKSADYIPLNISPEKYKEFSNKYQGLSQAELNAAYGSLNAKMLTGEAEPDAEEIAFLKRQVEEGSSQAAKAYRAASPGRKKELIDRGKEKAEEQKKYDLYVAPAIRANRNYYFPKDAELSDYVKAAGGIVALIKAGERVSDETASQLYSIVQQYKNEVNRRFPVMNKEGENALWNMYETLTGTPGDVDTSKADPGRLYFLNTIAKGMYNESRFAEAENKITKAEDKYIIGETYKNGEKTTAYKNYEDGIINFIAANYNTADLSLTANKMGNLYAQTGDERFYKIAKRFEGLSEGVAKANRDKINPEGKIKSFFANGIQQLPQFEKTAEIMVPLASVAVLTEGLTLGAALKVSYVVGSGISGFELMRGEAMNALTDAGLSYEDAIILANNEGFMNAFIESGDAVIDVLSFGATKALTKGAVKYFAGKAGKGAASTLLKIGMSEKGVKTLFKIASGVGAYIYNANGEGVEEVNQGLVSIVNRHYAEDILSGNRAARGQNILNLAVDAMKNNMMTGNLSPSEEEELTEAYKVGVMGGLFFAGMGAVSGITVGKLSKMAESSVINTETGERIRKENGLSDLLARTEDSKDKKVIKQRNEILKKQAKGEAVSDETIGKLSNLYDAAEPYQAALLEYREAGRIGLSFEEAKEVTSRFSGVVAEDDAFLAYAKGKAEKRSKAASKQKDVNGENKASANEKASGDFSESNSVRGEENKRAENNPLQGSASDSSEKFRGVNESGVTGVKTDEAKDVGSGKNENGEALKELRDTRNKSKTLKQKVKGIFNSDEKEAYVPLLHEKSAGKRNRESLLKSVSPEKRTETEYFYYAGRNGESIESIKKHYAGSVLSLEEKAKAWAAGKKDRTEYLTYTDFLSKEAESRKSGVIGKQGAGISEDGQTKTLINEFLKNSSPAERNRLNATIKAIDAIYKRLGFTLKLTPEVLTKSGKKASGVTIRDGSIVYVGVDTASHKALTGADLLRYAVGHEAIHAIRMNSEEVYGEILDRVKNLGLALSDEAINEKIDEYKKNGIELSKTGAGEELLAEFIGEALSKADRKTLHDIIGDRRNIAEALLDAIDKITNIIRAAAGHIDSKLLEQYKKARSIIKDAIKSIDEKEKLSGRSEDMKKSPDNTEDGVKYAVSDKTNDINERLKNIADSFGIKKIGDYIDVQKNVYDTLQKEGFFSDDSKISRTVINKDIGIKIEINKSSIKETFSKGNRYEYLGKERKYYKLVTIRDIANLIENAKLVSDDEKNKHKKTSSVKFSYLVAKTAIDGVPVEVYIDIRKSPQKNKMWLHQVHTQKSTEVVPTGASSKMGIMNLSTNDIIIDSDEDVNSNYMQNGEKNSSVAENDPKEMYAVSDSEGEEGGKKLFPKGRDRARDIDIVSETDKGKTMRFIKTAAESTYISQELAERLSDIAKNGLASYEVSSNAQDVKAAKAWYDGLGDLDEATDYIEKLIQDGEFNSNRDVARAILLEVKLSKAATETANDLERERLFDKAQSLAVEAAAEATKAGKFIQAFSLIKRLTPEGTLMSITKEIDSINKERGKKVKEDIKRAAEEKEEAYKRAADKRRKAEKKVENAENKVKEAEKGLKSEGNIKKGFLDIEREYSPIRNETDPTKEAEKMAEQFERERLDIEKAKKSEEKVLYEKEILNEENEKLLEELKESAKRLAEAKEAKQAAKKEADRLKNAIEAAKRGERGADIRTAFLGEDIKKLNGEYEEAAKSLAEANIELKRARDEYLVVSKRANALKATMRRRKKSTLLLREKKIPEAFLEYEAALSDLEAAEKELTIAQQAEKIAKEIANTMKNYKGKSTITLDPELKKAIMEAKDEAALDKARERAIAHLAAQMPRSFFEQLNSWRYLCMLGNLRTHIKNIKGNITMFYMVMKKNIIAGAISDIFLRNSEVEKYNTLRFADKETRKYVDEVYKEEKEALSSGGAPKYGWNVSSEIEGARPAFNPGIVGNMLNPVNDRVSGALEAEDSVALRVNFKSAMKQYMVANRLTPKNITEEQKQKAVAHATKEAKEATFRDANKIASLVGELRRKHPKTYFIVNSNVPFTATPTNMLRRAIEYSPLESIQIAKKAADKRNGKITYTAPDVINDVAKVSSGIVTAALGAALFLLGRLVIGGTSDEDKYKEEKGQQKFSIKLFGHTHTLDWLGPYAVELFLGAQIAKSFTEDEETEDVPLSDKISYIFDAVERFFAPIVEMSLLSSLSDNLEKVVRAGSGKNGLTLTTEVLLAFMENTLTNYLGQTVPTLSGQLARATDSSTRRTTFVEEGAAFSDLRYFLNRNKNKIPVLIKSSPEYVNQFGETAKRKETKGDWAMGALENLILPWYSAEDKFDKETDGEILRLKNTPEAVDFQILAPKAEKTVKVTIGGKEKEKVLNAEEYTEYKKVLGQTGYNAIYELIKSDVYKEMDDAERVRAVGYIWEYAKEKARTTVYPEYKMSSDSFKAEAISGGDKKELAAWAAVFGISEAKADKENPDYTENQARIYNEVYDSSYKALAKELTESDYFKSSDYDVKAEAADLLLSYAKSKAKAAAEPGYELKGDDKKLYCIEENTSLTPSDYLEFREYKKAADSDGNGSYKQEEINAALYAFGRANGASEKDLSYLWQVETDGVSSKNPYGAYLDSKFYKYSGKEKRTWEK